VDPERLARQLADNGQLGSVASDVLRSKALEIIAQRAKIQDEDGHEVVIEAPAAASASDDEPEEDAAPEE
jgi:trigger factor